MPFSEEERQVLLAVKGVGGTVIQRFEALGIESLAQLAGCDSRQILEQVASMLGSSCWKNSPQARGAVEAAIAMAQRATQNVLVAE